jgi:hypothetical protein
MTDSERIGESIRPDARDRPGDWQAQARSLQTLSSVEQTRISRTGTHKQIQSSCSSKPLYHILFLSLSTNHSRRSGRPSHSPAALSTAESHGTHEHTQKNTVSLSLSLSLSQPTTRDGLGVHHTLQLLNQLQRATAHHVSKQRGFERERKKDRKKEREREREREREAFHSIGSVHTFFRPVARSQSWNARESCSI